MVSLAKPGLICGYYGLSIIIIFLVLFVVDLSYSSVMAVNECAVTALNKFNYVKHVINFKL